MDPLVAWAEEAHWSMGGLNFKRHRLQGCIEGNIERLRTQREQISKKSLKLQKSAQSSPVSPSDRDIMSSRVCETPSPQPPPLLMKRRRVVVGLVDEDEEAVAAKKGLVRKLGDDFERVARECGMEKSISSGGESDGAVAARTRGKKKNEARLASDLGRINKNRKLVKGGRNIGAAVVAAATGNRSSPRLAKSSGLM